MAWGGVSSPPWVGSSLLPLFSTRLRSSGKGWRSGGAGHLFPSSSLRAREEKGLISLETIADGRTLSLRAREVEAAPGCGSSAV